MEYFLKLNQAKVMEWELTLPQACLFAFIYQIAPIAQKDGQHWYISRSSVLKQLPMLTSKKETVTTHFRALLKADLVDRKTVGKKQYWMITEKGSTWNRT